MKDQENNIIQEADLSAGINPEAEKTILAEQLSEPAENTDALDGREAEEETYKEMSPIRLVMRRFFRSKLSIVGIIMIGALLLFTILGPVVYTRWGEETADRAEYRPDIEYFYVDDVVGFDASDGNGGVIEIEEVVTMQKTINDLASPSAEHLLGTDEQGYDVFVRLMYGGRISLLIGFIVVILETLIGIVIGGISGYFGGWIDNVLMRIVDIFNCIPTLPILLIGSAVIDSWNLPADQQIYVLMVIITLFSWSGTARLVRGQILSLREQEYITATEVMGFSTGRRIFKHLIPNVMPQLIVSMTLGLGSVILYESTLSYLGLGVQLPKAAWGTMISSANKPNILNYHMNVWLPAGLLIVVAVLGFNFIGDGLRDAMDPKARK